MLQSQSNHVFRHLNKLVENFVKVVEDSVPQKDFFITLPVLGFSKHNADCLT